MCLRQWPDRSVLTKRANRRHRPLSSGEPDGRSRDIRFKLATMLDAAICGGTSASAEVDTVVCLVEASKVCLHCDDQCRARFVGSGPVVRLSDRHLVVSCGGVGVPRCSHLRPGFTLSGCAERVIGV
jgi:hypothetical protein